MGNNEAKEVDPGKALPAERGTMSRDAYPRCPSMNPGRLPSSWHTGVVTTGAATAGALATGAMAIGAVATGAGAAVAEKTWPITESACWGRSEIGCSVPGGNASGGAWSAISGKAAARIGNCDANGTSSGAPSLSDTGF